MKFLNAKVSFKALLWLIPCVLAVHNCEEALTMPAWVAKNFSSIQQMIPFHVNIRFSSAQLLVSLFLATLVPFVVTILCVHGEKGSMRLNVLFILQSIILLNVFIPHIGVSAVLFRYNPGVITAVVLNLPFSFYFFRRALKEEYMDWKKLGILFVIALILYVPVAASLHFIGEWMVH